MGLNFTIFRFNYETQCCGEQHWVLL